MGCGWSSVFKKYRREESGDGVYGYEVSPNDARWELNDGRYFPWDDDDEKTQKIDVEELWRQIEKERATEDCCCGAKATKDWNCHTPYCPAYRPYK